LFLAVSNQQASDTIWIQPIINATRISDGALEEKSSTPESYIVVSDGTWNETLYPDYGDLSGYVINNIRIRVFGIQNSGALLLNFDKITLNPGGP
jgi:hypothetical protein